MPHIEKSPELSIPDTSSKKEVNAGQEKALDACVFAAFARSIKPGFSILKLDMITATNGF